VKKKKRQKKSSASSGESLSSQPGNPTHTRRSHPGKRQHGRRRRNGQRTYDWHLALGCATRVDGTKRHHET
jgi:hypothetical protein